ncbi:MAG: M20/M25/M40 family metallo-hydrolase, partial [Candidatus Thorarchaeota archaeon]|nr:M20/M25/M40 family metallo-hydrolase [Candidatus Thorarchaeota archaeon]
MLKEAKALLIEMIRNKCVNPPGGEMRNINTVRKYLDSYGIESEVFESAPERGNLLAEIKGTGEGPSLMFGPSHVDVVPVNNPETWSNPPFEGIEKDGCIWGRGALDMLFFVASQSVVFARLHKEGFRPKGSLKLLIVADEEAGGTHGTNWMVVNHPEKVKVDYLITEQGGEPVAEKRMTYWYAEKGMAWLRLRFKGEEQHGSTPYGSDNAVVNMAEAVQRLAKYQPPRDTQYIRPILEGVGVSAMIKRLAGNTKTLPKLLSTLVKSNPGMAKLMHALSQMTISPNMVKGGTKVNVIPGEAILDVDIRLL